MTEIEQIRDKLRVAKRECRGDSKIEKLLTLISLSLDLIEYQQKEIETLRLRLSFVGYKSK